ncbi:MAG: hypothetical protein HC893_15995 [Chloroflexaceae bacterium]|nr:hypothetical protein [Chloroflexaceae bacterium]
MILDVAADALLELAGDLGLAAEAGAASVATVRIIERVAGSGGGGCTYVSTHVYHTTHNTRSPNQISGCYVESLKPLLTSGELTCRR